YCLAPLFMLGREIADVRKGKALRLIEHYPQEIEPLAQELNQLTEAGFGVKDVLADMGVGLKDVENGTVSAEKFIAAFNSRVQKDFGGAAKAQAGT
ncbi:hypothetical protein, partial [Streptococcus pneumoniae]|uniref:hypothetical protein n=1 Tax=Streptococcus pneumoniae TaxID=1313 RepID=UPI001E4BEBB5